MSEPFVYRYKGRIERPHDGDTTFFLLDEGTMNRREQAVRYEFVFASELNKPGGLEVTTFVASWFLQHQTHPKPISSKWPFVIYTEPEKRGEKEVLSFDRVVGVVHCRTCDAVLNDDVNAWLKTHPASSNAPPKAP